MSVFFAYVCTRSTVDPYIPVKTANLALLARDVSDGFQALSGGRNVVGQLAFFPLQRSVPNHLLCDGREVSRVSFPELFDYLGVSEGAPVDPASFKLPNYLTALTPATTAATETQVGGTVSSPDPTPPAPGDPVEEYPIHGPVDSGGRFRRGTGTETTP